MKAYSPGALLRLNDSKPARLGVFAKALFLTVLVTIFSVSSVSAQLTVETITWDIIGLDSNKPDPPDNEGPNHFPVNIRVHNTSTTETVTDVTAQFIWDETPSPNYINIFGKQIIVRDEIPPTESREFHFFVEVDRDKAAYDFSREYHIEVTSNEYPLPISTVVPRQLYVQKLIGQNRNDILGVVGPENVIVGRSYPFYFATETSTGYSQFESFVVWSNEIFQTNRVFVDYEIDTRAVPTFTGTTVYANGCDWDPVPPQFYLPPYNDPAIADPGTYLSCLDTGKLGDKVQTLYYVTILDEGTQIIDLVVHDFSGNSYHYNNTGGQDLLTVTAIKPTIAGHVFRDANINQIWDQDARDAGPDLLLGTLDDIELEPSIPSVELILTGAGPNNIFGDGDDTTTTTLVNIFGLYAFGSSSNPIPPGEYAITVNPATVPAGFALTTNNLPTTFTLTADINDLDYGYVDPALYANVTSIEAVQHGLNQPVTISWETDTEIDNLGFHLYYALPNNGTYLKGDRVTDKLIPGQGDDGVGASYEVVDDSLGARRTDYFAYYLADIDFSGKETLHGPVFIKTTRTSVEQWSGY